MAAVLATDAQFPAHLVDEIDRRLQREASALLVHFVGAHPAGRRHFLSLLFRQFALALHTIARAIR